MRRTWDIWGAIDIDDRGYAHRGQEYAPRAQLIERVSGLESPWRANLDGTYSSTYPVWSKAHSILSARSAARLQNTAALGAMPDGRPEFLKDYTLVVGVLPSAPLDLAKRFDNVVNALKRDGWNVAVKKIGTDFEGPLGIPVPRAQPLELWLHRTDRRYTALEAQTALTRALTTETLTYNPISATLSEYWTEVVKPTGETLGKAGRSTMDLLPWAITAGVLILIATAGR